MSWFRDIPLCWPLAVGWLAVINAIAGICYLAAWPRIIIEGPPEECFEVARFRVGSPRPLSRAVEVTVTTQDGSALVGGDYQHITQQVRLGPGRQWAEVEVPLMTPDQPVQTKRFSLKLARIEGARTASQAASATLGPWPEIQIKDTTVVAKPGSTPVAHFEVQVAPRVEHDVTVKYATLDGSAKAPANYQPVVGTIELPAGKTSWLVEVPVNPGRQDGSETAFALRLYDPTRAVVAGSGEAVCTIVRPPLPPPRVAVSIEDGRAMIDEGTTPGMVLPVRIHRPHGYNRTVRVAYRTEDGTALAAKDYIPAKGELVFEPSESEKRIVISLTGDLSNDVRKSFAVHLACKDPNLDYKRASAEATLTYQPPLLTGKVVSEPTADESGEVTFELRLSRPTHAVGTVECKIQPSTAKPGIDYVDLPPHFAVAWPPGETTRIVPVRTVANPGAMEYRTFELLLENPQGLRLTTPRLQARIGPALRFLGETLVLVVPTTLLRDNPTLLKEVNQIAQKRPKDVWRLDRGGLAAPWKGDKGPELLRGPFRTDCSEDVLDTFRSAVEAIERLRQRAESPRFVTFVVWCSDERPDDLPSPPDLPALGPPSIPPIYLLWSGTASKSNSDLLRATFRDRVYFLGSSPESGGLLNVVEQELRHLKGQRVQP